MSEPPNAFFQFDRYDVQNIVPHYIGQNFQIFFRSPCEHSTYISAPHFPSIACCRRYSSISRCSRGYLPAEDQDRPTDVHPAPPFETRLSTETGPTPCSEHDRGRCVLHYAFGGLSVPHTLHRTIASVLRRAGSPGDCGSSIGCGCRRHRCPRRERSAPPPTVGSACICEAAL